MGAAGWGLGAACCGLGAACCLLRAVCCLLRLSTTLPHDTAYLHNHVLCCAAQSRAVLCCVQEQALAAAFAELRVGGRGSGWMLDQAAAGLTARTCGTHVLRPLLYVRHIDYPPPPPVLGAHLLALSTPAVPSAAAATLGAPHALHLAPSMRWPSVRHTASLAIGGNDLTAPLLEMDLERADTVSDFADAMEAFASPGSMSGGEYARHDWGIGERGHGWGTRMGAWGRGRGVSERCQPGMMAARCGHG